MTHFVFHAMVERFYFLLINILFQMSITTVMPVRIAAPTHVKMYFMQA